MQCIQDYGSGSSDSESDNAEGAASLMSIDPKDSVSSSLSIVTAPDVVPLVSRQMKMIVIYIIRLCCPAK